MLMGNFFFMILPLVYLFEEQREIYSGRKNRLQIRFQAHVSFSFCPSHCQLYILQFVLHLGKKRGDGHGERAGFLYNLFYGMKHGMKAGLASFRP